MLPSEPRARASVQSVPPPGRWGPAACRLWWQQGQQPVSVHQGQVREQPPRQHTFPLNHHAVPQGEEAKGAARGAADAVRDAARSTEETARDAAARGARRASESAETVRDSARGAADSVRRGAADVAHSAKEGAEAATDAAADKANQGFFMWKARRVLHPVQASRLQTCRSVTRDSSTHSRPSAQPTCRRLPALL